MCKVVYLTSKRFDKPSSLFKKALAKELESRNVEVVVGKAYDFFDMFKKHKTYGIALAFGSYKDGGAGWGLTLNKNCSYISRDFAYTLSNVLDSETPNIMWRDFNFVNSDSEEWFRFFNKISSSTKAIFYLCKNKKSEDWESFYLSFEKIVKLFADEIIRCLRSNYNVEYYRKRVKMAKLKLKKISKK